MRFARKTKGVYVWDFEFGAHDAKMIFMAQTSFLSGYDSIQGIINYFID